MSRRFSPYLLLVGFQKACPQCHLRPPPDSLFPPGNSTYRGRDEILFWKACRGLNDSLHASSTDSVLFVVSFTSSSCSLCNPPYFPLLRSPIQTKEMMLVKLVEIRKYKFQLFCPRSLAPSISEYDRTVLTCSMQ